MFVQKSIICAFFLSQILCFFPSPKYPEQPKSTKSTKSLKSSKFLKSTKQWQQVNSKKKVYKQQQTMINSGEK